jgi:hypothetical protein
LPGLVVDRYDRTLVVKLYSPAWFPHLAAVVGVLGNLIDPERIVLRLSRAVAGGETFGLSDGDTIVGAAPNQPVFFRERGLTLEADVVHGQKTGHFLDQRDNRALVRGMAAGADVLDVFASTGGFSVSAAAGGARSVHLVDQSEPALQTARRNLEHNHRISEVRRCAVHTARVGGDATRWDARPGLLLQPGHDRRLRRHGDVSCELGGRRRGRDAPYRPRGRPPDRLRVRWLPEGDLPRRQVDADPPLGHVRSEVRPWRV